MLITSSFQTAIKLFVAKSTTENLLLYISKINKRYLPTLNNALITHL